MSLPQVITQLVGGRAGSQVQVCLVPHLGLTVNTPVPERPPVFPVFIGLQELGLGRTRRSIRKLSQSTLSTSGVPE